MTTKSKTLRTRCPGCSRVVTVIPADPAVFASHGASRDDPVRCEWSEKEIPKDWPHYQQMGLGQLAVLLEIIGRWPGGPFSEAELGGQEIEARFRLAHEDYQERLGLGQPPTHASREVRYLMILKFLQEYGGR